MDALPEVECDLELWALVHRKKKAKGAYFHPRTYEALEAESSEGDVPEPYPSSLLFARDSSSSSLSSAYRVQNDTLCDTDNHHGQTRTTAQSHVLRSVQFVGTLDSSDAGSDTSSSSSSSSLSSSSSSVSTPGSFDLNTPMDACQFIQNIPHMDLSLPFLPRKQPRVRHKTPQAVKEKECPLKRLTTTATTTTTNHFERTRKAVYSAGCGGFGSGLYESGLDGCLGGF